MHKKKIIISLVVIILFVLILVFGLKQKTNNQLVTDQEISRICYLYNQKNNSEYFDRAWLMYVHNPQDKNSVFGFYYNLPAEKDSKIGSFSGTVSTESESSYINGIWDTLAEGMYNQEEIQVKMVDGTAEVMFGEMVEGENGVYNYKDRNNLFPSFQMNSIDCETLDDHLIVENYIRENIQSLIQKEPVLGGNWYPTKIQVFPETKTVSVDYEDGHVTGNNTFSYERNEDQVSVTIIN